MTAVEEAANYHATRRHYTDDFQSMPELRLGRSGHALCSTESNLVQVYDGLALHGMTFPWQKRRRKPISELPLCKRCARINAKRSGK